jgi:hypothetical protein
VVYLAFEFGGGRKSAWFLSVRSSITIAYRNNGTTVEPFPQRSLSGATAVSV